MAIPAWLPYALAGASVVANTQSQKKKDNAAANARRRQQRSQEESDAESARLVQEQIDLYRGEEQKQEALAQEIADSIKREQYDLTAADQAARRTSATPVSGGEVVGDRGTQARSQSKRYTDSSNQHAEDGPSHDTLLT